jgi:late competence protein required for DNA uptake (superfamily II DNA/RNA helicase)
MADCPVCGKPLAPPTLKCDSCKVEIHKDCAKKTTGKHYCKSCFKEGKKLARYERMAQRAAIR